MSATAHGLPLAFVAMLWFFSTALVVALDHRTRGGVALMLSGLAAAAAVAVMALTAASSDGFAAYASFTAAFVIWGWHELAFLTGAAAGPRRDALPQGARGWTRFRLSAATVMTHELALVATLALLTLLSWGRPNPVGAMAFALLFAMRLSTKLNIFLGVPNFSTEMLPPQLSYLKSYFRARAFNPLMPVSLLLAGGVTWALAAQALASSGDAAVMWSLLTGLSALGLIEHLFLVLPIGDSALWRWAIPAMDKVNGEVRHGL